MYKYCSILFISLFFIPFTQAQYNQSPVLPGLEGGALYDALVEAYKPDNVLDYDRARDTLFRVIYGMHDSLFCVYTQHGVYMDPDRDPTSYVYHNGRKSGLNTEHTYPRSKGARYGNAKSDMHHLFPAKINVNSARSNYPFGEIRDEETEVWFYKEKSLDHIPTKNIDAFSESKQYLFEPREAFKGNIARAMFYFYTMYRQKADDADNMYFDSQRKTLCQWHQEDPVDSMEYIRTFRIAAYQDGKVNPFVIDCTLATRLYCDQLTQICEVTGLNEADYSLYNLVFYGNPMRSNAIKVQVESPEAGYWTVRFFNLMGQEIARESLEFATDYYRWDISQKNLPKGIYFLQFSYKKTPSGKSLILPTQKLIIR